MQRSLIWLGPDGCLKTGCNNTKFKLQGYPLKKVYLINIRAYKLKLKVCIPTGILFTTAVANAGLPVKQLLPFLLTFRKEQTFAFLLKCFTYVSQSFMDYRHLPSSCKLVFFSHLFTVLEIKLEFNLSVFNDTEEKPIFLAKRFFCVYPQTAVKSHKPEKKCLTY